MQLYQNATIGTETQEIIAETAVVLELLAFALAIIAQPGTPALFGKVLAVMAQHTAANWAELLSEGGEQ